MMEKINYQFLLLVLLSVSCLLLCFPGSTTCQVHPPAAPPAALDLTVEQICQRTKDPSLCISTLTPLPSELEDSPTAILGVAVNATLNSTQVAIAAATRMLANPDPSMPGYRGNYIIENCQVYYRQAIEELQTALWAIDEGDVLLFIGLLNQAKLKYEDCEDLCNRSIYSTYEDFDKAFVRWIPDDFSPFNLAEMAATCLDIRKAIHWDSPYY